MYVQSTVTTPQALRLLSRLLVSDMLKRCPCCLAELIAIACCQLYESCPCGVSNTGPSNPQAKR